jgi:hypothetical protein
LVELFPCIFGHPFEFCLGSLGTLKSPLSSAGSVNFYGKSGDLRDTSQACNASGMISGTIGMIGMIPEDSSWVHEMQALSAARRPRTVFWNHRNQPTNESFALHYMPICDTSEAEFERLLGRVPTEQVLTTRVGREHCSHVHEHLFTVRGSDCLFILLT